LRLSLSTASEARPATRFSHALQLADQLGAQAAALLGKAGSSGFRGCVLGAAGLAGGDIGRAVAEPVSPRRAVRRPARFAMTGISRRSAVAPGPRVALLLEQRVAIGIGGGAVGHAGGQLAQFVDQLLARARGFLGDPSDCVSMLRCCISRASWSASAAVRSLALATRATQFVGQAARPRALSSTSRLRWASMIALVRQQGLAVGFGARIGR
jgi:hypothetical protein